MYWYLMELAYEIDKKGRKREKNVLIKIIKKQNMFIDFF